MWWIKEKLGLTEKYITDLSSSGSECSDVESDNNYKLKLDITPTLASKMGPVADYARETDFQENSTVSEAEADVATDAIFNFHKSNYLPSMPVAADIISLNIVKEIEKHLDQYEIVSLVYLLYIDANFALQELMFMLRGTSKNLLFNWAKTENNRNKNWQNRLVESLCIIKNYKILKMLGYEKQHCINHYLPHQINAITSLNKSRKAVYLVCEDLDNRDAELFLNYISQDFKKKEIPWVNYDYLELHFLKWETLKYVSLEHLNIKDIFKVMEKYSLYNILNDASNDAKSTFSINPIKEANSFWVTCSNNKSTKPGKVSNSTDTNLRSDQHSKEIYNRSTSASICTEQDNSMLSLIDKNDKYYIDEDNPGVILIINQQNFYTEIDPKYKDLLPLNTPNMLEQRDGTLADRDNLADIFGKFGFRVIVKDNLRHDDMLKEIKEVAESIRQESTLFVCILSHGEKGAVFGCNSCKVNVSKIQEVMSRNNQKNLRGKPKVLILQCCQGSQCQKLEECSEEEYEEECITMDGPIKRCQVEPEARDIFTFYATVPGFAAIRNKRRGSWFIQALCKNLRDPKVRRHHFEDICTKTLKDVSNQVWEDKFKDVHYSMTPFKESTLGKFLYFPPLKSI